MVFKYNNFRCAEYIREKNLRYEDCDEKSPSAAESVTLTDHENKRTNPQVL